MEDLIQNSWLCLVCVNCTILTISSVPSMPIHVHSQAQCLLCIICFSKHVSTLQSLAIHVIVFKNENKFCNFIENKIIKGCLFALYDSKVMSIYMYRGVQRENNNDNKNVFPNFRNLHGQCQLILGEKNIQVCSLERSYTLPSNDNRDM